MGRHPSLDERDDPAVRIVAHDPAWAGQARAELERIKALLPDARVAHFGSTAVPGLPAKPILDLQVALPELTDFVAALEGLGYLHAHDPASPERHFFGKPHGRPRTHHVHVCRLGSDEERRHLAVRDFLIAHPDEARAYGGHKRAVVARTGPDRIAYIEGKEAYVTALQARALTWAS